MNYRVLSPCNFFVPSKICIELSSRYNYFSTVPLFDKINARLLKERKDYLKKL